MVNYVISDNKIETIEKIKNGIERLAKELNCNMVCSTVDDREFINLEVPEKVEDYFKTEFLEMFASKILYINKDQYYRDMLKLNCNKNVHSFMLLKTLIFADFHYVKEAFKKEIEKFHEFSIDGIENFILRKNKEGWKTIALETNRNLATIASRKTFRQFIRYLIENLNNSQGAVNLMSDEIPYLVTNDLKKLEYSFSELEDLSNDQLILATLIEHFPAKVNVFSKNLSEELTYTLEILYDLQ